MDLLSNPSQTEFESFHETPLSLHSQYSAFVQTLSNREKTGLQKLLDKAKSAFEPGVIEQSQDILNSDELLQQTFESALDHRFGTRAQHDKFGNNLYLDNTESQLRAFELLRLKTPLISFAYAAANRALLNDLEERSDITIIDIGIGFGGQIKSLILHPRMRQIARTLKVIGVEPSGNEHHQALHSAKKNILDAANQAKIPTVFHGISRKAESLTLGDIANCEPTSCFLANCCLALHHIHANGKSEKGRNEILTMLRKASVRRIVLVEPDSAHNTDILPLRLLAAYRHYRTVWNALGYVLTAEEAQKVFHSFFKPEVFNILAYEGKQRTERHETSATWIQRLRATGWTVDSLDDDLITQTAAPPGFRVGQQGLAFNLSFRGISLLSVLSASSTTNN